MHRARVVVAVLFSVGLVAPLGGIGTQAPQTFRILIGNDDGVHAPGIAALAQTLQAIGDVTIVAPAENFSGAGHSIVTTAPVFREDLTLPNGLNAIGLTATPASTIDIALRNIMPMPPDLVVTGINRGYNLGLSIYVSGTNGAAREAAFRGIPAIATSIETSASPQELGSAAEEVLGVARRVKQYGMPKGSFLNVNVPSRPAGGYKGYLVTTAATIKGGMESFAEVKRPASNQTVYWDVYTPENLPAPQGTDIWAVSNGYVSVTPLRVGETDAAQMDAVRGWFK
jgi:5'-nucleotidase